MIPPRVSPDRSADAEAYIAGQGAESDERHTT